MAKVIQSDSGLPATPEGGFIFRIAQVGEGIVNSKWGPKERLFWQCEPEAYYVPGKPADGKKEAITGVWAAVTSEHPAYGTAAVVITGNAYAKDSANKGWIDALLGDRALEWLQKSGDTDALRSVRFVARCHNRLGEGNNVGKVYANLTNVQVDAKSLPADFGKTSVYVGGQDLPDPFENDGYAGGPGFENPFHSPA